MTASAKDLGAPLVDASSEAPRPWGFWATLAWTLAAGSIWFGVQVAATVALLSIGYSGEHASGIDTATIAVVTLVSAPAAVAVFVLAARLRGWKAQDYLALTWPRRRDALIATACVLVCLPLLDVITWLSGRDIVHPFIAEHVGNARDIVGAALLIAAFVIAAPLVEELAFRGFTFRGWAASRLGWAGAVLLSSLLWTALHTQYEPFFLWQIFALGLLLGWIRHWTGSTALTIALHAFVNAVAMVQGALRTAGMI